MFSLKLTYQEDTLVSAVLDGIPLDTGKDTNHS